MTTPLLVKICGLRTPESIDVAVEAGADAIGIVHAAGSPRTVDLPTARALVDHVARRATTVLVVKGIAPEQAAESAREAGVDVLQVHGYDRGQVERARELFPRVWRATSPGGDFDPWGEELLLIDSPRAGSGERWDLRALLERRPTGPWMLAGGLDPDNVARAILDARPAGVDVSSGVESAPGVKDLDRIRRFAANARP